MPMLTRSPLPIRSFCGQCETRWMGSPAEYLQRDVMHPADRINGGHLGQNLLVGWSIVVPASAGTYNHERHFHICMYA